MCEQKQHRMSTAAMANTTADRTAWHAVDEVVHRLATDTGKSLVGWLKLDSGTLAFLR